MADFLSCLNCVLPTWEYNYFDNQLRFQEVELNLLQIFLRVVFGCYEHTHLKTVAAHAYKASLQGTLSPLVAQKILKIIETAQLRYYAGRYDWTPVFESQWNGSPVSISISCPIVKTSDAHNDIIYKISSIGIRIDGAFPKNQQELNGNGRILGVPCSFFFIRKVEHRLPSLSFISSQHGFYPQADDGSARA